MFTTLVWYCNILFHSSLCTFSFCFLLFAKIKERDEEKVNEYWIPLSVKANFLKRQTKGSKVWIWLKSFKCDNLEYYYIQLIWHSFWKKWRNYLSFKRSLNKFEQVEHEKNQSQTNEKCTLMTVWAWYKFFQWRKVILMPTKYGQTLTKKCFPS